MKHLLFVSSAVVAGFVFAGCSSAPQDPGVAPPTTSSTQSGADGGAGCTSTQQNANGACYPTSDIGTQARSGNIPGNRIENYAFTGYPWTDVTSSVPTTATQPPGATKTVRMSDFYDPQGTLQFGATPSPVGAAPIVTTGIKIIHLVVSAVWCNPCNQETDMISGANYTGANPSGTSWAKDLAPLGVVFIQALDDGAVTGVGATLNDLNQWISHHQVNFTDVLDPNNQNLGVFFDAAAIPFNANIDARSMEILSAGVGFDTNGEATIKNWVNWVNNNPPKQ